MRLIPEDTWLSAWLVGLLLAWFPKVLVAISYIQSFVLGTHAGNLGGFLARRVYAAASEM